MNQRLTEVQAFLESHPSYLKRGCGNLSKKFNISKEDVRQIKKNLGFDNNLRERYKEFIKNRESGLVLEHSEYVIDDKDVLPNILILDIETAPIRAFVWRLWKQDIYIDQIISDWFMLTWSAKFLGSDITYSEKLTGKEAVEEDDSRIVKKLWNLLNDADMVVAHNGDAFDLPKIRSRFAIHGLPPTTFYHQIDTKKIAAKEFGFASNKLDALAKSFGIGSKIHTEFELWSECMKGNDTALEEMRVYNVHDVEILEKVYLKLRPYIKNHPNVTFYSTSNAMRCPSCGGKHLYKESFYYTHASVYQTYRCQDCGALSRDRKSIRKDIKNTNLSLAK